MCEMKLVVDNRSSTFELPAVTFTPGVCGGDPCIPGTRIPAALVYEYHRLGWSVLKLVEEYPELTYHQVAAAIAWIEEHPGYWHEWKEQYDG